MRNKKLGNVPDFGDPKLNIAWAALQKLRGGGGASEAPAKNMVKRLPPPPVNNISCKNTSKWFCGRKEIIIF